MQDFEVGQTLQQNIIPKAVLYFTGEALEGGDEDEDDVSILDVTAILAATGFFMVYILCSVCLYILCYVCFHLDFLITEKYSKLKYCEIVTHSLFLYRFSLIIN